MMILQGQFLTGIDDDVFDLVTFAQVNALIRSPGPAHLGLDFGLRPIRGLQRFDDGLHVLGAIPRRDENRVGGFDNDVIPDSGGGHQSGTGMNEGPLAVFHERVAGTGVPAVVRVMGVGERGP